MKLFNIFMAFIAAIVMAGCTHNDDHDEHHHDEHLQLFGYSANYEVYAPATPFVVGEESHIPAHITKLSDFKPLESGEITATLSVGGASVRQTLKKPEEPGIFEFHLKPTKTGKGSLTFEITAEGKTESITIPNVTVYSDEHEAHHAAAEEKIETGNGVSFPKEQSWKMDFSTAEVHAEPFGQVIKTMGKVAPTQTDEHVVSATTSGLVSLSNTELVAGRSVAQGQTLMTVTSNRMADDNLTVRINEAKVEYQLAKQEYERKKALLADKLTTQSELLAAQGRYESAKVVYTSLTSNFGNGTQTVKAPISGYVTRMLVSNGQYVEAGQPLIGISRNNQVLIEAQIQPRYYNMLGNVTSANFLIPSTGEVLNLQELGGRMLSFSKAVDQTSPMLSVTFEVRNTPGLIPGTFVDTYIKLGGSDISLVVPDTALVEEMGNYFVYVQLTPEYFEKREVKIGRTDGEYTQILSGLKEGERIVAKGAVLVKLAQSSGKLDAHSGHVH